MKTFIGLILTIVGISAYLLFKQPALQQPAPTSSPTPNSPLAIPAMKQKSIEFFDKYLK